MMKCRRHGLPERLAAGAIVEVISGNKNAKNA